MTKFQVGDRGYARGESYFGKDLSGILLEVYSTTTNAGDGYIGVKEVNGKGSYVIRNSQFCETEPKKPTKNQRISALEDKVAKLERVVAELTNRRPLKPNPTLLEEVKKKLGVESVQSVQNQTNNQKRAAIIEKAKRFVEERQAVRAGDEDNQDKENGNKTSRNFWYETEFFVKDGKVTALVYWLQFGKKRTLSPKEIGRSKCHPHDCFNEHIGKAIALGRALGLDVSKFEQAVQPDEVVVGMIVAGSYESKRACYSTNKSFTIKEKSHNHYYYQEKSDDWLTTSDIGRITNDTNAQYEEAKAHESNKAF